MPSMRSGSFRAPNGNYLLGDFDGTKFTKESGPYHFEYRAHYLAAQTYSDIPRSDGQRIQIAWMNGGQYPGMPFNQQMSLPGELTLRSFPEGIRLLQAADQGTRHVARPAAPLERADQGPRKTRWRALWPIWPTSARRFPWPAWTR